MPTQLDPVVGQTHLRDRELLRRAEVSSNAPCLPQSMRIIFAHNSPEAFMLRDRPARKRAVNLFVDVELLEEARRLRINISETLERRLRTIVKAEQERRWLEENRAAIEAYNRRVAKHGLLSDHAGLL
jgi:antitoxin CcdA